MPRAPHAGAAIVALAVVAALAACTSGPASPGASATVRSTASPSAIVGDLAFTVGTLFPSTGAQAYIAAPMVAAAQVAVNDINAAGGVNGKPVALVARDSGDASSPTAEASFADLVANHADVVIGPVTSSLAQRLLGPAQKAGVPLVSPSAGYPQLAGQADFFRTVPAFGHEGAALGALLPGKGAKRVVLVATTDPLGNSIGGPLATALAAHGGTLAASIAVPASGADANAIAAQAAAATPDAVVLATPDNGDLTKALIASLSGAGLGGGRLWLTGQNLADYSQALPGGLLNGVNGILEGADADPGFQAKLKAVDGGLAGFGFAAETYDAVVLAALAADTAHVDSGSAVASHLLGASRSGIKCGSYAECLDALRTERDIDYDGLSGTLNLGDDHAPETASYGIYAYNGDNQYTRTATVRG